MTKPRQGRRSAAGFKIFIAALIAITLGGVYLYWSSSRQSEDGRFPLYPIVNIDQNRTAGNVVRGTGSVFMRTATPEDIQKPEISPAPSEQTPGWVLLAPHATYLVGALFHARPGAKIELMTTGNFLTGLDGEGEFVLEDLRRNEDGTARSATWFVKRGMLRIKPHDYDPADAWVLVKTQTAQVEIHKGEFGIRVHDGGTTGQLWLMKGQGRIRWKDGREQELKLREILRL